MVGAVNDGISSSLNVVVGKLDVTEGRILGHESSNKSFVDKSSGLLRDHVAESVSASSDLKTAVALLKEVHDEQKGAVDQLKPLLSQLNAVLGMNEELQRRIAVLEQKQNEVVKRGRPLLIPRIICMVTRGTNDTQK